MPPATPASITSDSVKNTPNQLTSSPRDQADQDEDALCAYVGGDRGGDAVDERRAASLHPGGATAAEHEAEHRAEEEERVEPGGVGVDEGGDQRQGNGEQQAHADPGADRSAVPAAVGLQMPA